MDDYSKDFINQTLLTSPMSPIEYFNVLNGTILLNKNEYGIELFLEPFKWENKKVSTSIRMDSIDLNNLKFSELSNKTFKFAINPNEGYIDGSVYIESMHNPIDVTLISFGSRLQGLYNIKDKKLACDTQEDYIVATILYKFVWEGGMSENYPEIQRANVILQYIKN